MSNISLHLGDCLEVMHTIPDGSVDMVLADLPYGTTACKWDKPIPFEPLWKHYKRVIKRNGAIVLFGSQPFTTDLINSNRAWFRYTWVWEKDRVSGFLDANKKPLRCHEDVCVFYVEQPTYNPQKTAGHPPSNRPGQRRKPIEVYRPQIDTGIGGSTERFPRSVLKVNTHNSAHSLEHPTQKPVALMEYLIRTYTNEGEMVLDNVCGSGTTLVACLNTNRNGIGIEKDAGYFAIAEQRIKAAQDAPQQLEMVV